MWDKIVKLLFKIGYKDKEISLIVMSCCQTENKAEEMIDYLEKNINNKLTRNDIIEEATRIRAKH